jgi:ABC-type multidrug transport system fused ATPase/permease subunit
MSLTNKIIKYFFKEHRLYMLLAIFLNLLINVFKVNIISIIIANIIKSVQENNFKNIYKYYKYFLYVSVIFIIIIYITKYVENNITSRLKHWIKLFLIKNILYDNNENLQNLNYTKLQLPLARLSSGFDYMFGIVLSGIIPQLTLILVIFCFFMYKNIKIGLLFLVGNLILLVYIYRSYSVLIHKNEKAEEETVKSESALNEILNNFNKIIFRGMKDNEINLIENNTNNLYKINFNLNNNINNVNIVCNIIVYGILLLIIFYLIYLYSKKSIVSITFITLITILLLYKDLILVGLNYYPRFIEFIVRNNIILKKFNINLFDKNSKKEIPVKILNPKLKFRHIEFKNINFQYEVLHELHPEYTGSDGVFRKLQPPASPLPGLALQGSAEVKNKKIEKIFDNFNLKIDIEDKIIGITGLSGNGKSTLIKLFLKIYPHEGSILIDNIDIKNICTKYLRENIIYVDQSGILFDRKIIENIFYGTKNQEISQNFLNKIYKYPKINELYRDINFKTKEAGFNGNNLSGGQRQVINIINGLISPSIITIFDEPTNALDPELKKEILQLIKDFKKYNKCIIIITHDKDVYEILDKKIEIKSLQGIH